MKEDPADCRFFVPGETWSGCWECLKTLATCSHLATISPNGPRLVVSNVDRNTGVITLSAKDPS